MSRLTCPVRVDTESEKDFKIGLCGPPQDY